MIAASDLNPETADRLYRKLIQQRAHVSFLPFVRQPSTYERVRFTATEPEPEHGATVIDTMGGGVYDVVLDSRGRPTYYAARALDGALTTIDELPRQLVAALAATYLRQLQTEDGDPALTLSRDDALRTESGQPRAEWVAQVVRDAHAAGVSPRVALQRQTGKPYPTIDRWLREARAADPTLPQATRHPRKPKGTNG